MPVAALALLLLQPPGSAFQGPAPFDTTVDAGGYRMHLVVHRGARPLTIVLESGGGASLASWAGVGAELAARTQATVVAYDRAGFGRSEAGPHDLTPVRQVEQLDRVLERLGTPADRLVVGTSYGGLMAVIHAHRFPSAVRGLVLVDPMSPRFVRATGDFVYSTVPRIERPVTRMDTALVRLARTFDPLMRDPLASDVGLTLPIVLITAGDPWWGRGDVDRAWRTSHEAMVRAAHGRRLVVADGSAHDIPAKRPDTIVDAALVLMNRWAEDDR